MAETNGNGGAKELRGMIFDTVQAVDRKVDKLYDKIDTLNSEFGNFKVTIQKEISSVQLDVKAVTVENKVKTAAYGLIGGLIPALVVLIYFLVSLTQK